MTKKWSEIKAKVPAARQAAVAAQVKQDLLEMELRELREVAGKTQVEVAAAAEMAQSELSRFERREDFLLSSLRRYVEALGGELEVVARFGDRAIRLRVVP